MEVSGNNVCATSSLASAVPSTPSAASSTVPCGHSRQRSLLLDLHADAFNYLCSFIPIDDLLLRVAGVSSDVRRRVWANHELWQQLWMRYLRDFYDSLIPSRRQRGGVGAVEAAPRTPSPAVAPPPGSKDVASSAQHHVSADTPTCSSAAWRLYYYHRSQEARPRVELLDRLSVTPHNISDPQTAEAPHASASSAAGAAALQDRIHDETLRFCQACATQLVVGSVTHLEAGQGTAAERSSTHHYTKKKRGGTSSASAAAAAAPLTAERKAVSLARRRARQAARLRRVLRFLLSANDHRPILHDRLWTSTYEAGEAYERSRERRSTANTHSSTAAASSAHLRRKGGQRGGGASAAAAGNGGGGAAVKDTLRPLSWLDDRERSVKVILFDDNSRTVGDLGSVQAERIKLLSAIAHHWRLAYAHQFYLTGTDGADRGSGQPSPPPLHPSVALRSRVRALAADASAGLGEGQPAENPQQQQQQQREDEEQQVSGRLLGWEQTYRRFRDDGANTASARIRDSLRRVVTAGSGGGGDASESSRRASGQPPHDPSSWLSDSARRSVIPSSGNPLFDLHLLTHTRRKNFYAAMLASTVEVPEGMGAFFATSVSEPFLRWWCWRSRCLLELTNPAAVARGGASGGSSSTNKNNNNSVGGNRNSADALQPKASSHTALVPPALADGAAGAAVPHTIWVARVCSVHKPQYGTTASDGSFGRPAPIEAEESIAYSSSYSDVTSTSSGTLASASSIEFEEDVMLEEEMRRSSNADEERAALGRDVAAAATGGSEMESDAALLGNVANPLQPPEAEAAGGNSSSSRAPQPPHHTPSPPPRAPRVALLFPLPHMLAYWFMVHHVTFYSYQVYRRMWGDQEINIAVCSRILSPTGHTVECRLFYTLRCSSFPRMYTKMMFTPGTLPTLTMPEKLDTRSPYRSHSTSSDDNEEEEEDSASSSSSSPSRTGGPTATVARRRDSDSDSAEEREGNGDTAAPPPAPLPQQRTPSSDVSATTSSDPRRGRYADLEHRPVDGREVYDLFWTGFGRVEVESGPTISRSNLVRLRVALGLPVDYPMGLLWNVLMFASGVGPLILKDHRHSLYFNYPKSFTDVVEEEFGEASCYGYGARPATAASERPMPNPLDAEVRRAQEQHELDEAARILVEGAAAAAAAAGEEEGNASHASGVLGGGAASFSTAEGENDNDNDDGDDGVESSTSSLTTSAGTFGSWGLDSEFSSMGEHSSWRDWRTPYSDAL